MPSTSTVLCEKDGRSVLPSSGCGLAWLGLLQPLVPCCTLLPSVRCGSISVCAGVRWIRLLSWWRKKKPSCVSVQVLPPGPHLLVPHSFSPCGCAGHGGSTARVAKLCGAGEEHLKWCSCLRKSNGSPASQLAEHHRPSSQTDWVKWLKPRYCDLHKLTFLLLLEHLLLGTGRFSLNGDKLLGV